MEKKQDKKKASPKSPWRWVFLAGAVLSGGYLLLQSVLLSFGMLLGTFRWTPGESASIGIIGGADGPTAIFVTTRTGFDWALLLAAAVLALCIIAFLRLRNCRKK